MYKKMKNNYTVDFHDIVNDISLILYKKDDTYFRREEAPLVKASKPKELERIIELLVDEKFIDKDGIRQLQNPENFEYIKKYEEGIGNKYVCLCSEDTCSHLIITRHKPTGIKFAVGSQCILRFCEENDSILYDLTKRKQCFMCNVNLVFRKCKNYESNTKKKYNGLCNDCWDEDKRIYLNVKYEDKEHAKIYNARWNPKIKCWYINSRNIYRDYLINKFGKL